MSKSGRKVVVSLRDDNREDMKKEEKTCKGIQRETRMCDAGSCSQVRGGEGVSDKK